MRKQILTVDIDSMIPNLALEKITKYFQDKGHEVFRFDWRKDKFKRSFQYDKIFVSCVFSWNRKKCENWESLENVNIGGSGYSLTKELPSKVESIKPKINLGFATRGCIRNCPFCIVPHKEGGVREVGDVYDIWDGKSKAVTFMDNNILALPSTFFKIAEQLNNEGLATDFNQGLDHRLLTDDITKVLMSLKIRSEAGHKIRFAFDDIRYKKTVLRALKMLKKYGMKPWNTRWYVYIGVNDTMDTVLPRLNLLKEWEQAAFVMRDRDERVMQNKEFAKLYSWSTNIWAFSTVPYSEFASDYKELKYPPRGFCSDLDPAEVAKEAQGVYTP